jgi:hypothetical protein
LVALVGAHLRRSVTFADVSFGTTAEFGLGAAYALFEHRQVGTGLALEWLVKPALQRDERGIHGVGQRVETRRVPSDWMLSVSQRLNRSHFALAFGTSIPLSTRNIDERSERFAGPPGVQLRLRLSAEVAID